MAPIITLTTDFGLAGHYVASVKGSIFTINPQATIVDISHDVPAHAIEQAAFLLACALPDFPRGSIHLAVVDPGVGTQRRALAFVTEDGVFVGPDNGILSAGITDARRAAASGGPRPVPLPRGARAYVLSERRFHGDRVSDTFHARDVFAPVAAHISLGTDPSELGPRVEEITALPPFRAEVRDDGTIVGRVVHIDRFGNVITTVVADQLRSAEIRVEVGARTIEGLRRTYAECEGLSALIGSSGYLEIALNSASAAKDLGAPTGDPVVVRPVTEER